MPEGSYYYLHITDEKTEVNFLKTLGPRTTAAPFLSLVIKFTITVLFVLIDVIIFQGHIGGAIV